MESIINTVPPGYNDIIKKTLARCLFRIGTPVKTSGAIWNPGNWRDKAGGYGIQEPFGAMAVQRINGDFYNVMGLPVARLYQMLKELGLDI